ncbi:RING finger protein nhl-1-like isoform X2 [Penaeus monodon]|uniref:RING finger protein nhl-1-like isoform X2 n=1 Tax=Penaeus monodon TaxID=6687 RepID=UPI0018A6E667|nr:RING finger protein nhl-1-like isoform X2 [Penaeus monodon]
MASKAKVKMPGATTQEPPSERRRLPKRSSSSASSLRRDPPGHSNVVITGYTSVNTDLPPITSSDVLKPAGDALNPQIRSRESPGGSPGSSTSSGVSSLGSASLQRKLPRSPAKRSASMHQQRPSSVNGFGGPSTSDTSSVSSSPESESLDEDELTCAICLDLLHRPRSLPCGHSFCLVCLQNYVNSCRMMFTCPSCRAAAQVPHEGVVGLPTNRVLAKGAQVLRQQRQCGDTPVCFTCHTAVGVSECGHCGRMWCDICGASHALSVRDAVVELQERLVAARETLFYRVEEDEFRFDKLEENIKDAVTERIEQVNEDGRRLISQWKRVGRLHAKLSHLVKAVSAAKGPRVTLDDNTFSLSTPSIEVPETQVEVRTEEGEEKQVTQKDYSLLYRSKSSLARIRWGQHLGERPAGVAVSPWTSQIFVSGSDTCRIFMFDSSGRQVSSFGSRGRKDGQFLCPISIAFSHVSKEVFISDKWKHCIHVFDSDGNFIRQLGRKGKGFGHFISPEGIATDRFGRIYVADTCNHRVQILDSDGVFLREVGVVSSETLKDGRRFTKSEFNEPSGVAASLDGSRVYVVDTGNHRIKVFDGVTGERVLMFGSRGQHKGQFESPECIAVDAEGFILVGDSGNGRVQVFRPNGNFVRYLGTRGNCHGEFGWVSGIAVSKNLDVVVTDFKNNLVAMF